MQFSDSKVKLRKTMATIESEIDVQSESYQKNAEFMSAAVEEFRGIEKRVIQAAAEKAPRYKKRGLNGTTRKVKRIT